MNETNGKKNTETTPLQKKKKTQFDYMKTLSSLDSHQQSVSYQTDSGKGDLK